MKILIDSAYECHRAINKFGVFSNSRGQKTGVIFGYLRAINSYRKQFGGTVIAVWEGRPKARYEIQSTYKSDRPGIGHDMLTQIGLLQQILRTMGILQVSHPDWEADDVLATLATRMKPTEDVIIVTGDDDLLQVVSDSKPFVKVYNPRYKQMYDEAAVVEKYGVGPKQLALLWAIEGDASDGIKGVPGLGDKFSLGVVRGTCVSQPLADLDRLVGNSPGGSGFTDGIDLDKLGKLRESMGLVRQNYDLLTLRQDLHDMTFDEPRVDPKSLEVVFRDLELKSFLKDMQPWLSFSNG